VVEKKFLRISGDSGKEGDIFRLIGRAGLLISGSTRGGGKGPEILALIAAMVDGAEGGAPWERTKRRSFDSR